MFNDVFAVDFFEPSHDIRVAFLQIFVHELLVDEGTVLKFLDFVLSDIQPIFDLVRGFSASFYEPVAKHVEVGWEKEQVVSWDS